MNVGVLALQGNFAEHIAMFQRLGVAVTEIRTWQELERLTHLVIPGGESTTMRKLLKDFEMDGILCDRVRAGDLAVYGSCAGAILLSSEVVDGSIEPLGLIDITTDRNAYGRQVHSFRTELSIEEVNHPVPVAFIRAPKIKMVHDVDTSRRDVSTDNAPIVLATHDGDPVLVQQGNVLAGTFHTETTGDPAVHELFIRRSS